MRRPKMILAATAIAVATPAFAQGYGSGPYGGAPAQGWMAPGWGPQGGQPGYGQGWMPGPGTGMMPGYPYGRDAYGQMAPGPGMMAPQGLNAPGRGRFAAIDANEDGIVSAEEAASHADLVFTAMDADDDGMLTLEEYLTVRLGPQDGSNPARESRMQANRQARFDPMDADGDGQVSKQEFMAAAEAEHAAARDLGGGQATPFGYRGRFWN